MIPLLGDRAAGINYYHWLVDILPRGYALEHLSPDLGCVVLAPAGGQRFVDETLETLLDARPNTDVRFIDRRSTLRARETWLTTYPLGDFTSVLPSDLVAWVRQTFGPRQQASKTRSRASGAKIYIRRASDGPRCVANAEEIEPMLESSGFRIVELETMSVADQAASFASAGVIVSAHGAGLANTIFCREADVIELCAPGLSGPHYAYLSIAAGNSWTPLWCRTSHGDRYLVDPAQLEVAIRRTGPARS